MSYTLQDNETAQDYLRVFRDGYGAADLDDTATRFFKSRCISNSDGDILLENGDYATPDQLCALCDWAGFSWRKESRPYCPTI